MSLRIGTVDPSILWRNGRRANRTLIFFVMHLRFGITANTKRSGLDCTPIGYGRGSDLVRLLSLTTTNSLHSTIWIPPLQRDAAADNPLLAKLGVAGAAKVATPANLIQQSPGSQGLTPVPANLRKSTDLSAQLVG